MTTLIIDGYNFIHRARCGFSRGEYSVVFTFFRNLRSLIETFQKSHQIENVKFVIEGHPQFRYDLMESYKGTRKISSESPNHQEMVEFHRQKEIIINLLKTSFPIEVIRHCNYECDDVINHLIKQSPTIDFIVVSNDSDFIQLLNKYKNVKIFNPMLKNWVEKTEYDYVTWKSIVGDGSDNIPGISKGIGDKRAKSLISSKETLESFLNEDLERKNNFERNYKLISFANIDDNNFEISQSKSNWDNVKQQFEQFNFASLLKEKSWQKFIATFDVLSHN